MEADNQNTDEPSDGADEAGANLGNEMSEGSSSKTTEENEETPATTASVASTGEAAGSSSGEAAVKPAARRNYRRRGLESSDDNDSSDNGNDVVEPEATANAENAMVTQPASESDDVSLDEVQVSDSDGAHREDRSSTDSDSSFSFGSPLSPLLRFGLGSRQRFGEEDSDSNATSDEEVVDRSKRLTRDIMSKEAPQHCSTTWPKILMNRENGFYCKRSESRYANHRKVFERSFYGSLNSVQRLELMAKLNEHFGCVNCLGFSKSGLYLLSGSDDLRVILWSWYNNKPLTTAYTKHRKNVFQCKFYEEDGANMKVISASADGSICTHQFTNSGGHTEKQIYTHAGAVHKLAIAENVAYTCGEDGLIIEFDFRTKTPAKMVTVREKHRKIPLFSISAHPTEMKYAVSGRDQFVRVYDRRNHKTLLARHCPSELLEKNKTTRYISACVYNYNGTELLASFNDENIYLFDASNHTLGSYVHKYRGHVNSATIKGVNFFGPQSEYIVSGSDCSKIFFWDKKSEAIVQYMQGDENGIVNVLEPHPIYPILASSGLDKDIKIWMPSNEDFKLNKEELEKYVLDNMKTQIEASQASTFSLDPAIIQLARRFFQQRQRESTSPNPLAYIYRSSDEDSSSS